MIKLTEKWDFRFLKLAQEISTWSKDPSSQVGAVIVDQDRKVVSLGYNGLPQGMINEDIILRDRDLKLQVIIHAEENALITAARSLKGYCIYTWPFPPCSHCSSLLEQSKIARVVAPNNIPERWKTNINLGQENLRRAGIEIKLY